jgi:uncharacterized protein YecT (DUF1311 family)
MEPEGNMRPRLVAILILLAAVPVVVNGQTKREHPIDKALTACMEKDPSTAGMVECLNIAYEAWDKELNRVYGALMSKLPTEGKASLKAAQLEWIKYRDLEFKLISSVYSNLEGTMFIPMATDSRIGVIKRRVQELQDYLDLLNEFK